jgi:hypothetical protein
MEAISLSRRQVLALVALAAVVLLAAGRYLTHAGATRAADPGARAIPVATPEVRRLVVHVVGAVRRPGLYRLRDGSRIADAVARARAARSLAPTSRSSTSPLRSPTARRSWSRAGLRRRRPEVHPLRARRRPPGRCT